MRDGRLDKVRCRVGQLLKVDSLTSDSVLCSFITPGNTIPFSALLTDSLLVRLQATPGDLSVVCRQLHLQVIHGSEVKIPFTVLANELVLLGCQSIATQRDITCFLRLLHGPAPMSVVRGRNGSDYLIRIGDCRDLIALWHALKFVKFNAEFLSARLNFVALINKATPRPRHLAQAASRDPALDLANFPPLSILGSGRKP
jgi:hypothetical protein